MARPQLMHPPVDEHLGYVYFLAIRNNAVMNISYKYLFEALLIILSGKYPKVELMDHVNSIFMFSLFIVSYGIQIDYLI